MNEFHSFQNTEKDNTPKNIKHNSSKKITHNSTDKINKKIINDTHNDTFHLVK
jgi:hypothetical protein